MTFKAHIENVVLAATTKEILEPKDLKERVFLFSKTKIFFTDKQKMTAKFITGCESAGFKHESKYTFNKVYDDYDKKRPQITILNIPTCKSFLKMDLWNTIKCNIIHNRYLIDREKEWFLKTLIAAAIGFLFAIIGNVVGYHQGYQSGLKEGKAIHPDTTLRQ